MRKLVWLLEGKVSRSQYDYEPGQRWWFLYFMGAAVIVFIIPWTQTNLWWLWILLPIIAFAGSYRYRNGPGYVIIDDYLRDKDKREGSEKTNRLRRGQNREPINAALMSFPIRPGTARFKAEVDESEEVSESRNIGVTYFPPRDSDSSMTLSSGWLGANLDPEELFDASNQLSNSLLEPARKSPVTIGYTQGIIFRPYNMERSRESRLTNFHPKVNAAFPGTTTDELLVGKSAAAIIADAKKPLNRPMTADEVLNLETDQREAMMTKNSSDTFCFYSLNVPRPTWWPKGERGNIDGLISEEDLYDAPIVELTKMLEDGLIANGVRGVKTLDLDELTNYVRVGWDLKHIKKWHQGADQDEDGNPIDLSWPWQDYVIRKDYRGRDYTDFGGTYHRMFRLERLDKKRVEPGQLTGLFIPGDMGPTDEVGFMAGISGDTILASEASRRTTSNIRWKKAYQRYKRGAGTFDMSDLEQEEAQLLEKRRNALDYGGSHALNFNAFAGICVTGDTHEEKLRKLAKADAILENRVRFLHMTLKRGRWATREIREYFTLAIGASMV